MRNFACIFPGQGSQVVGMADGLLTDPLSADVFRETNDTLGFDLTKIITDGPQEELTLTANSQPAILATSFAAWKLLVRALGMGALPVYVAGHSLGEFTALAASGALDLGDAVKLVRKRGELMQNAVPEGEGAMAALIGAGVKKIEQLLEKAAEGDVLDIANLNTPGQTVISGHAAAIDRALSMAKEFGVKKAVKLRVSAPFHSKLMKPVRGKFAEELDGQKFMTPFCPVVHNVTAWPNTEPRKMIGFLAQQIDNPVRWVESIQFMLEHEVDMFIEVGHGKVLQGLVKNIAGRDFKGIITGFSSPEDIDRISGLMETPEGDSGNV